MTLTTGGMTVSAVVVVCLHQLGHSLFVTPLAEYSLITGKGRVEAVFRVLHNLGMTGSARLGGIWVSNHVGVGGQVIYVAVASVAASTA
jgi:hypothetical protein